MSINLGDAILYFAGDDSQLSKTFDQNEQKASSWVGRVGGFFKNALGGAVLNVATMGIQAVAGSVGDLVSGMVNGNAEFEQYNTRFETMLGSAAAAKQRMADLAEFGAKTPFELPDVVKADTILQGFGLHSEEAAKKFGYSGEEIRTIAGDVASGVGAGFDEMSLLLGKFSAGATGEAISRMQELGITSRDQLTQMGLQFSKSGELLSPLPEAMNTVLGLMKDKYGGLMDAQSATFSGMMSNLQDWWAGTLRTVGQPLFDVAKESLSGLLSVLNDPATLDMISGLAQGLAVTLKGALDSLKAGIDYIWPAINNLIKVFQSGGLESIFAVFEDGSSSFGSFLEKLGMSEQTAEAVSAALGSVVGAVQFVINAIRSTIAVWQDGGGGAQQYATIIGLAKDYVVGVVNGLVAIVSAVLKQLSIFWQQNGTEIMAFVQQAWDTILNIVTLTLTLLNKTIVPILQGIAAFIGSHTADIQQAFSGAWQIIQSVITTVLGVIQGLLKTALALISGDWKGAWEGIKETFATIVNGLEGIMKGALDLVKGTLKLAISGFITAANALGAGIVSGIEDAIRNGADAVADAIFKVVDGAINYVKKLFGIASPSKYSAEQVGEPIVLGIAKGMLAALDVALQASDKVVDGLYEKFRDAAKKIKGIIMDTLSAGFDAMVGKAETQQSNTEWLNQLDMMGDQYQKKWDDITEKFSTSDKLKDLDKELEDITKRRADNLERISELESLGTKRTKKENEELAALQKENADDEIRKREIAVEHQKEEWRLIQERAKAYDDLNAQAMKNRDIVVQARTDLYNAEQKANEIRAFDAKGADEYFALRSKQIKDLAEAQMAYDQETNEVEKRKRLTELNALKNVQDAELAKFEWEEEQRKKQQEEQFQGIVDPLINGSYDPKDKGANQELRNLLSDLQFALQGRLANFEGATDPNSQVSRLIQLIINTNAPYEPILADMQWIQALGGS